MTTILALLDTEWPQIATSLPARRALTGWAKTYPVFKDFTDLTDVLACRRNPAVVDDVLGALSRLAPSDELAARTLLQMLLPGLVCIVGSFGHGDPDAADEIVSIAWERIRTYPTTRNGSVAANVVLDVRKRFLASQPDRREVSLAEVPEVVDPGPTPEELVLGVLMVEDVAAAQRDGYMTAEVFSLIMRTRLGGEHLTHVAAEKGAPAQLLEQRRWRAERRLRSLPLAA